MKVRIDILKNPLNPSTPDILDAFARAFDPRGATATFETSHETGQVVVQITGLSYESGSRGMFCIRGNLMNAIEGMPVGGLRVEGFYNAEERAGYLQVSE